MSHVAGSAGQASSDAWLTDCDFLVHADSQVVTPLLAQATTVEARLAAAVYRTSLHEHQGAGPGVRRQLLSLDAARFGNRELADRFAAVPVAGEPEPLWAVIAATGSNVGTRLLFQLDGAEQGRSTAVTEVDGRPVAIHGGVDGIRMWDLTSGERISQLPAGLADLDSIVTITELDGRLVALTESFVDLEDFDDDDLDGRYSEDFIRRLQVWDLSNGEPLCEPFTGPRDYLADAACTIANGHPIVVTFTRSEPVTVWDLSSGEPLEHPLFEHDDNNVAVACATVHGRPVVVTAMVNTVRIWGHAGGEWACDLSIDHPGWLSAVAITDLDGRPVVVTGSGMDVPGDNTRTDHQVWMWDLATGEPIGQPLSGHNNDIETLACAVVAGRTVAVTGGMDRTALVWDLTSGCQLGRPLTGHRSPIGTAAIGEVNGQLVAVTGDIHDKVRTWDLTAGDPPSRPASGLIGPVHLLAGTELDGRPVVVTVGTDSTVRVWDPASGEAVVRPLVDPAGTAAESGIWAIVELDGRPVVVTGDWDSGLLVRDLINGQPIGQPFAAKERLAISMVACTMLDGHPIALIVGELSETVRRWELTTGEPLEPLTTGKPSGQPFPEPMLAVACTALDGRPIAVAGGQSAEVWRWDLATGEPIGEPLTGHLKWSGEATGQPGLGTKLYIRAVTCTELDGRPIAVTGGDDGTVRRWDLVDGRPIGEPLTGHDGSVEVLACTQLNGRPIVVSGGRDHTVRVWDLASGGQLGPELTFPEVVSQLAATPGGHLVVGFGPEIAILSRWRSAGSDRPSVAYASA